MVSRGLPWENRSLISGPTRSLEFATYVSRGVSPCRASGFLFAASPIVERQTRRIPTTTSEGDSETRRRGSTGQGAAPRARQPEAPGATPKHGAMLQDNWFEVLMRSSHPQHTLPEFEAFVYSTDAPGPPRALGGTELRGPKGWFISTVAMSSGSV